ncbi:MAG: hypothetical protein QOG72_1912 [Sphingomonadales bacterium]|jgi:hypothetical protein|nr:hypothetical protein [Sphingomonadales bacterium]
MTYRIEGLKREAYADLLGLTDAELAERGARRVTVDAKPGFPCRVAMADAEPGERLILFNHVSNDVPTPFRSAYAIYVREEPGPPACYVDETPPAFEGRVLSLRGFNAEGMLAEAMLAEPGQADAKIRHLFERPEIAEIHAHNAAAGCFAARIVRD